LSARRLFVANWKMHKRRAEASHFAQRLGRRIAAASDAVPELVVAPPFTALDAAKDGLSTPRWSLAGQNVAAHAAGAYTGEIAAFMLFDAGCRYAIVGHSERRRLFGETPQILAEKLERVREVSMIPIYCLGETSEERGDGLTDAILSAQVETLSAESPEAPLVVAYEPVWAIGTGTAATPDDVARSAATLRRLLANRHDVRLLYGGSVTPANSRDLLGAGMDGFLIGGASLDADQFADIAGI